LLSLIGEYCQRLYQLAQNLPFYQLRDLEAEAQPAQNGRDVHPPKERLRSAQTGSL
jgi:hypothetical protein